MKTNTTNHNRPRGKHNDYHGSHWIRQERRLALYLRDGLACVYCNASIEDEATLSLDHIIPYSKGGNNLSSNLVTACNKCNCSRGDRPVEEFAQAVAAYLGTTAAQILEHIRTTTRRQVDINAARELIHDDVSCKSLGGHLNCSLTQEIRRLRRDHEWELDYYHEKPTVLVIRRVK